MGGGDTDLTGITWFLLQQNSPKEAPDWKLQHVTPEVFLSNVKSAQPGSDLQQVYIQWKANALQAPVWMGGLNGWPQTTAWIDEKIGDMPKKGPLRDF